MPEEDETPGETTGETPGETPPEDRHKAVYLIMVMQGIGMLMPWNMFINARSYFVDYKLSKNYTGEDTDYATYFLQSIGFASQIPNIICNWINVFIHTRGSITPRIASTLSIEIVMFIVTTILAVINTSNYPTAFFWSTMTTVVIINMANGIYQNTIYGIAAKLPFKYTGAVILGCDISGMLISVITLLTDLTASNMEAAATCYFVMAFLLLLACLSAYFILFQIKFYRYYMSSNAKPSSRTSLAEVTKIPYWRIFKTAFRQLFNVFFVFFVTLSVFPEMQANIRKSDSNFIIPDKYYSHIMCFLTFNITALVGCILANFIKWPSPKLLLIPVLLRALFIPFFFFCNYQPVNKVRKAPVLIPNDWLFWLAGILLGLSSGLFSNKAMSYTRTVVEEHYMAISGMLGAAFLVTGILTGIMVSMIFPTLAEI